MMRSRESYDHPGPLGPALDTSRVTGVDLHHTVTAVSSDPEADVRAVARIGVGRFGRSSYNFVIHPAAPDVVWEMQGLHVGAHNDGENSTRVGLAVIGDYQQNHPSEAMVDTISRFVVTAHEQGWSRAAHIKGHRDTDATACPGINLYNRLPSIRTKASEMSTHGVKDHFDWDREEPRSWAQAAWDQLTAAGVLSESSRPGRPVTYEVLAVLLARFANQFGGDRSGFSEADVRRLIRAHAANPDAHHA